MEWTYVLGIVVLILASVLRFCEKISEANCVEIFLLVIGALIGGIVGYTAGYKKGVAKSG